MSGLRGFLAFWVMISVSCEDKKYEAAALIQIHPSSSARLNAFDTGNLPLTVVHDGLKKKTSREVASDEVLALASERAGVEIERIRKSITVVELPRTDLIKVSARYQDRATAVSVANAVAEAYVEHREVAEKARAQEMLAVLDDELKKQEDVERECRGDLIVLISNHRFRIQTSGFSSQEASRYKLSEEKILLKAREKLEELETDQVQLKSQLEILDKLSGKALVSEVIDAGNDKTMLNYTKHREALDHKNSLLAQGMGSKHPEVLESGTKAEQAMVAAEKEANLVREEIKKRLDLVSNQVRRMSEMINTPRPDPKVITQSYQEAQANYETARDRLKKLRETQKEARAILEYRKPTATLREKAL